MIILDTDALTFLERRQNAVSIRLRQKLTHLSAEHRIVTTVVTYEEQTRGWIALFAKARDSAAIIDAYTDLLQHLDTFKGIDVIAYSPEAESQFQTLRKQKIKVGTRDLRIAAIALSLNATLFSRNLHDFRKIPHLHVEDWTQP